LLKLNRIFTLPPKIELMTTLAGRPPKTKKLYSVKEISQQLSMSASNIYKLVSQDSIPYIRVGGKILFDQTAINKWIKANTNS
jgi:excisionase family DNA binding protein